MDREARQRLIDRLLPLYDQGYRSLTVTLEEFFEGNTDEASIGGGHLAPSYPSLESCHRILRRIRDEGQVHGVFLEVCEVPQGDDELDLWVSVIRAVILTGTPLDIVGQWLEPLSPRDVWEEMNAEGDFLRSRTVSDADLNELVRAEIKLPQVITRSLQRVRVVWVDLR